MRLGFHYHSTFKHTPEGIWVPGYIGVFMDALSQQTDSLIVYLEEQQHPESVEEDYLLKGDNITLVNLGPKSTFYKRLLFPASIINKMRQTVLTLDALLLRSPSPLSPHIFNAFHKQVPVFNLLVGNYKNGISGLAQPPLRKLAIATLIYYYQWLQNRMVSRAHIIVNSGELYDDNVKRALSTTLVKTTTLSKDSFFNRTDTCSGTEIHLLYTGRINFQKGLRELIDAVAAIQSSKPIHIDIVGWEEPGTFSYIDALKAQAKSLGFESRLHFHGKKQIGPELNTYYQQADIYVIPSYHEGFPRTIWEAMANSLPVIATTVGSIPHFLTHKKNVFLIEPKQTNQLVQAIECLLTDATLRQQMIEGGQQMAKETTLEYQTEKLLDAIKLNLY